MKKFTTILLLAGFLVGLSLLLYPTVSDLYNAKHQSQAVADYTHQVEAMDDSEAEAIWQSAVEYNQRLAENTSRSFNLSEQETQEYEAQLSQTEVMAYLEIPSIRVTLPIYHGVDDNVLQAGLGHFPGSSLPVGGESTHCVLSGHRGLPSSKLLTDLDQLVEGDVFMIDTLEETLTYEVDQILIVTPEELDALQIVPGEDLCTLVTCTPYGVNTHRLLVRGHRIENLTEAELQAVTADAVQIEPVVAAPFAAVPIFLLLLIWVFGSGKKRKKQRERIGTGKPHEPDQDENKEVPS
jgi:sortase A